MARRITSDDWNHISSFITDELKRRRDRRKDLDKAIKTIDRQIAMTPDISYKLDADGRPDINKAWMPETELPLQAQTLEVLTADARRLLSPDSGPWFQAHANVTDSYLDSIDLTSMISGDENDVPSTINQDNVDKLVAGTLDHFHSKYDFWGNLDKINAEAFAYGTGIGRGRMVKQTIVDRDGKASEKMIPVLVPRSLKNTYLDDSPAAVMNEGIFINPGTIECKYYRLKDIQLSSRKGNKDPRNMGGGWIPSNLQGIEGDNSGNIQVIEYEGDLVVPRKTGRPLFLPNVLITVIEGKKGKEPAHRVIRYRENPYGCTYIEFPYHCENIESPYATSPLMKGMPIQIAAVEALNRMLMAAAINTQPPLTYDADDPYFAKNGGPSLYPGASIPTTGDVDPIIVGDAGALFSIYMGLLQQYNDVTGVNAPRLGAQTVSHTTAFAKQAELSRGTVRTVDYVKSVLKNPLKRWLEMEYRMGRDTLQSTDIFIESYGAFVTVSKETLPENVFFIAHGSGGPSEEEAIRSARMSSLQLALQIDQINTQYQAQGIKPSIDMEAAMEQTLREGKWTDVDIILKRQDAVEGVTAEPAMGQLPGIITQGPEGAL